MDFVHLKAEIAQWIVYDVISIKSRKKKQFVGILRKR